MKRAQKRGWALLLKPWHRSANCWLLVVAVFWGRLKKRRKKAQFEGVIGEGYHTRWGPRRSERWTKRDLHPSGVTVQRKFFFFQRGSAASQRPVRASLESRNSSHTERAGRGGGRGRAFGYFRPRLLRAFVSRRKSRGSSTRGMTASSLPVEVKDKRREVHRRWSKTASSFHFKKRLDQCNYLVKTMLYTRQKTVNYFSVR